LSEEFSGFAFILDSLSVQIELPVEIIPGHWLRKANSHEIELIKNNLRTFEFSTILYEHNFVQHGQGMPHLPEDEWKYYVIYFIGSNEKIHTLQNTLNLLKDDISLGYTFLNQGKIKGAVIVSRPSISVFFVNHFMVFKQSKYLGSGEVEEIGKIYKLLSEFESQKYPNVFRAVEDFENTKIIPNTSTLKILTYFSIIESLLTHPPIPTDRVDSTTRQITYKMLLLGKRFPRSIEYKSFFPTIIEPEKVWKTLYSYRSLLAHGGEINFANKFSQLKNADTIRAFLAEITKLLILYAFKEPDLLADLQKC
jgi:hypothetical protein